MLPFQKLRVKVITIGSRNRHRPGVTPGGIPGEYFPLLFTQIFGRVRGKGNLPLIPGDGVWGVCGGVSTSEINLEQPMNDIRCLWVYILVIFLCILVL